MTPPPRRRHRGWLLAAALLVVLVAWGAAVALRVASADRALRAGIAAAHLARAELSLSSLGADPARTDLGLARADFLRAHDDMSGLPVGPLAVIPILGTQIRSVQDLSGAAAAVSGAGSRALAQVATLLDRPGHGSRRAATVAALAVTLDRLRATVDSVNLGPAHGLLPPLVAKRDTFAADLLTLRTDLAKATGAASALTRLLRGPSHYLLLAANNAEMRAGAGMALEAGELDVSNGRLHLGSLRPTGTLVNTATTVRPSGDLAARWGFEDPAVDFRDLLLSPQFPANAALAARMWQADSGRPVDGVLLVDVPALADLLAATGPVQADGVTLDAGDAESYLLQREYDGLPPTGSAADAARQQVLGALAAATLRRAEAPGVSLAALVQALDRAVDGRDILAWAADPAVEADWQEAGAGGVVSGDDLLLALLNQGADKLDPYQEISARADVAVTGTDSTVTVRVAVRNATPPSVSGYAAGGFPGGATPRHYRGALSLDYPSYAGDLATPGRSDLEAVGPDYGASMVAVPIALAPGAATTVTFRFVLLGSHGSLTVLPSARVPPTAWSWSLPGDAAPIRFSDDTAHTVTW
jgi:hypothetical protein